MFGPKGRRHRYDIDLTRLGAMTRGAELYQRGKLSWHGRVRELDATDLGVEELRSACNTQVRSLFHWLHNSLDRSAGHRAQRCMQLLPVAVASAGLG